MKKKLLSSCVILILVFFTNQSFSQIPEPLKPITFEDGTEIYQWDTWGNLDDPLVFSVVDNPDKTGINVSDKVAKYICNNGSNSWAGMNIHDSVDITITDTSKYFTMDVYKSAINKVVMVLEQGTGEITRFDAYPYNTKTDEWETLVFDFSSVVGHTFYRLTIQPDLTEIDPRTEESVVYLDNIKWSKDEPKIIEPLEFITFEDGAKAYEWTSWGNNGDTMAFSVVDNPDISWGNSSAKAGQYICHEGSNNWAGMNITDSVEISITEDNRFFRMDVLKPGISKVVMVLEQGNGEITRFDSYPYNTKTGAWETMIFDFSSVVGHTFYRLTIQPDLVDADPRTDSSVIYLDNIKWSHDAPPIIEELVPITFEEGTVEYTWDIWGNLDDTAAFKIINNPDKSGINMSEKVGEYICHAGSNSWAGMNIRDTVAIRISENNKFFTMDVYKPNINKVVMILEHGFEGATRFDSYPYNTKTNEWETLVFDMSAAVGSTYFRLSIQPDLTEVDPRTDSAVVYLDNIQWYAENPITSITNSVVSHFQVFPNPSSNYLNVSGTQNISSIEILNINGRRVKMFRPAMESEYQISLDGLNTGLYFLRIVSKDLNQVIKFIKL